MTERGIEFMQAQDDKSFLLHLSFIKPHWPHIAPAPYHDLSSHSQIVSPVRSDTKRDQPYLVIDAHMDIIEAQNFSQDTVRLNVVPAYMRLIKLIDDQTGNLFALMRESDQMDDTIDAWLRRNSQFGRNIRALNPLFGGDSGLQV